MPRVSLLTEGHEKALIHDTSSTRCQVMPHGTCQTSSYVLRLSWLNFQAHDWKLLHQLIVKMHSCSIGEALPSGPPLRDELLCIEIPEPIWVTESCAQECKR